MILAAGGSRRLGRPKQLLKHRGAALLVRALRLAHDMTPGRVVVVLGAQRLRLRLLVRRHQRAPTRLVHNGAWQTGMAGSLRRGLDALPASCGAALLLVVDQPGISRAALARLLAAASRRPGRLVAATYGGRPGVPAVIPRRYWRELRRLGGDQGARRLLRRHGARVIQVELPEAAWDIDVPEDAARLG